MKKYSTLFLAAMLCLIMSCSKVNEPIINQAALIQQTQVFNSHFDFADMLHDLKDSEVVEDNQEALEAGDYDERTLVTLPENYFDKYGNQYTGSFIMNIKVEEVMMEFIDFSINDVAIRGKKIKAKGSSDGNLNWCADELTYILVNGEVIILQGCFNRLNTLNGYEITEGNAYATINGERIDYEVVESLIKDNNCRWLSGGIYELNKDFRASYNAECTGSYSIFNNINYSQEESNYHTFWK